jgi:hypothetical protein
MLWQTALAKKPHYDSNPHYEALSYRWQEIPAYRDCKTVSHIHIEDQFGHGVFPIRKALVEVLFVLRRNICRLLLIDQICIN